MPTVATTVMTSGLAAESEVDVVEVDREQPTATVQHNSSEIRQFTRIRSSTAWMTRPMNRGRLAVLDFVADATKSIAKNCSVG